MLVRSIAWPLKEINSTGRGESKVIVTSLFPVPPVYEINKFAPLISTIEPSGRPKKVPVIGFPDVILIIVNSSPATGV